MFPSFSCPITHSIMKDPVMCADGHSYERDSIQRWFSYNNTSPHTGAKLPNMRVTPNHALRNAILEWEKYQTTCSSCGKVDKRAQKCICNTIFCSDCLRTNTFLSKYCTSCMASIHCYTCRKCISEPLCKECENSNTESAFTKKKSMYKRWNEDVESLISHARKFPLRHRHVQTSVHSSSC